MLDVPALVERLRAASQADLIEASDAVQDDHEKRSRWMAWLLAAGLIALDEWHRSMGRLIRGHLADQMLLGARGNWLPFINERFGILSDRETEYLDRFAKQLEAAQVAGRLPSGEYIANRADQYMGIGRGEFYRAAETTRASTEGWVAEYQLIDGTGDGNTCEPCHRAAKVRFYLPGEGPYPGQICQGRGRCRCRRILRNLPAIWKRLVDGNAKMVA